MRLLRLINEETADANERHVSKFEEELRGFPDAAKTFVQKYRKGKVRDVIRQSDGTFNVSYRIIFQSNESIIIRLAVPGMSMFLEEKVTREVTMMRFLAEKTSLPVPRIIHWGMQDQCPLRLAPFIVMTYIEHEMTLQDALEDPGISKKSLYKEIAAILLELSQLSFPTIGSLVQKDSGEFEATGRPLSMAMNEMVRIGTVPRYDLSDQHFLSASSYLRALLSLHTLLALNHPSAAEKDWTPFFLARELFGNQVRDLCLEEDPNPFRIWCDDLCAANILVAEGKIVGIIDWEFSFTAPQKLTYTPPCWLTMHRPDHIGIDKWTRAYEERLPDFLEALETLEKEQISRGLSNTDCKLSRAMRDA